MDRCRDLRELSCAPRHLQDKKVIDSTVDILTKLSAFHDLLVLLFIENLVFHADPLLVCLGEGCELVESVTLDRSIDAVQVVLGGIQALRVILSLSLSR